MKTILFILCFLFLAFCAKTQSIRISATPVKHILPSIPAYLIFFSGESNSGGKVDNSLATTYEKSIRASVTILNNNSLQFESLHIGVNNLIGHSGFTCCIYHGWELGLANSADSNTLVTPVYLAKTGQGGSGIQQWTIGNALGYYDSLTKRIDTARKLLTTLNGGKAPALYLWYSQGINDANNNLDTATWKAATKLHFANLRARYGLMPIFIAYIMPNTAMKITYNLAITALCNEITDCYPIIVSDLVVQSDTNHWDYPSMKIIAQRMIASLKSYLSK
jgi:hypothetical protein